MLFISFCVLCFLTSRVIFVADAAKIFGMYQPSTQMNGFANSGLWNSPEEAIAARTMPGSTFTMNALNLQQWVSPWGTFVYPTPYALNPNYQQIFNAAAPTLQALQANGSIAILFLGDELRCHGMPTPNISAYAAAAKQSCPACLVYYNECSGTFSKSKYSDYRVPSTLDMISVDYYPGENDLNHQWVTQTVVPFYRQYIIPKLPDHTKFMFVPQASGWTNQVPDKTDQSFEWSAKMMEDFAVACQSEGRCAGAMPWYWLPYPVSPSCPKCNQGCSTSTVCISGAQAAGHTLLNS